ncbi:hypothetical protein HY632_04850 [Candidatus Uhrbacteria bacterium]|nr:hypothetical protein [Candidatus Uhrbacteria bacterium]
MSNGESDNDRVAQSSSFLVRALQRQDAAVRAEARARAERFDRRMKQVAGERDHAVAVDGSSHRSSSR